MKIAMEEKAVDIGSAPGDRWWNHRFSSVYPKEMLQSAREWAATPERRQM